MSSARKKWPVGPLQSAIDRACITHHANTIQSLALQRGFDNREAEKIAETYRTGIREGFVTLRTVDSFSIDILGVHPIEVYGMDYFNPEYDTLSLGKPCEQCGGPKEEGRLHLCRSCARPRCACGCGEPALNRNKYAKGHNVHGRKAA